MHKTLLKEKQSLLTLEGLEILGFIFHLQETIIEGSIIWKHTDLKATAFFHGAGMERDRRRQKEVDFSFSQFSLVFPIPVKKSTASQHNSTLSQLNLDQL